MSKTLKIFLNILVFALVVGFGYYMVSSIAKETTTSHTCNNSCGDCPQRARCGVDEVKTKSSEAKIQCQCKQKIDDDENE